jgi:hypothetical protein
VRLVAKEFGRLPATDPTVFDARETVFIKPHGSQGAAFGAKDLFVNYDKNQEKRYSEKWRPSWKRVPPEAQPDSQGENSGGDEPKAGDDSIVALLARYQMLARAKPGSVFPSRICV